MTTYTTRGLRWIARAYLNATDPTDILAAGDALALAIDGATSAREKIAPVLTDWRNYHGGALAYARYEPSDISRRLARWVAS